MCSDNLSSLIQFEIKAIKTSKKTISRFFIRGRESSKSDIQMQFPKREMFSVCLKHHHSLSFGHNSRLWEHYDNVAYFEFFSCLFYLFSVSGRW